VSRWGRAQDALFDLYEHNNGYSDPTPGPAMRAGLTFKQWTDLIEPILEAVAPIFGSK
jgi:hypothetical protein